MGVRSAAIPQSNSSGFQHRLARDGDRPTLKNILKRWPVTSGAFMASSERQTPDRDLLVYERYLSVQRARARALITNDLIEEHRRKPLGHHSDDLARLAFILGNGPHSGKYAIRVLEPFAAYQIIRLSAERGRPPQLVDEVTYTSPDHAYHAIFLRRIADL
jgi:branched-chain amino acid transport system permease protein